MPCAQNTSKWYIFPLASWAKNYKKINIQHKITVNTLHCHTEMNTPDLKQRNPTKKMGVDPCEINTIFKQIQAQSV